MLLSFLANISVYWTCCTQSWPIYPFIGHVAPNLGQYIHLLDTFAPFLANISVYWTRCPHSWPIYSFIGHVRSHPPRYKHQSKTGIETLTCFNPVFSTDSSSQNNQLCNSTADFRYHHHGISPSIPTNLPVGPSLSIVANFTIGTMP